MKNIVIFGAGYVGFSLAVFLARKHKVTIFEVVSKTINMVNSARSPILDQDIEQYLEKVVSSGNLVAKTFNSEDLINADIIILALPTNYDVEKNEFDTSVLDAALRQISEVSHEKTIVIKSTIPVGYTDKIVSLFNLSNCFYSPEFLREGKAIYDNFHPSRIVVGSRCAEGIKFAEIMENCSHERTVKKIFTDSTSAEVIKLASNTYLAMRIAFFNEVDSYAITKSLDIEDIISGICADPRIGEGYNNPSFSYGGYCLPKDVRQFQSSVQNDMNQLPLISSIHASNEARLNFIVDEIERRAIDTVGIFRLQAKQGSDNHREASNFRILKELVRRSTVRVILYEPSIQIDKMTNVRIYENLDDFEQAADLIVANRHSIDLNKSVHKVFSRDIYNEN